MTAFLSRALASSIINAAYQAFKPARFVLPIYPVRVPIATSFRVIISGP